MIWKDSIITSLFLIAGINKVNAELPFDIYGDDTRFEPHNDISVDKDSCMYTARLQFNFPAGNLPFPAGPESCTIEDTSCEGKSCLFDVRNVHSFSPEFRKSTGFDHVGLDWSPCGHPPLENYGKPHLNLHLYRVSPQERETMVCDMLNPFICTFPPLGIQSSESGRNFFVIAKDAASDAVVNVPATFDYSLDSAVPGEGLHLSNVIDPPLVGDWFDPILALGTYGGTINFWELMFPADFSSGDTANFYDQAPTYNSQTIASLPSYWSLSYDPETENSTLTMKGKADKCTRSKSDKKPKHSKKSKTSKAPKLPKVKQGKNRK